MNFSLNKDPKKKGRANFKTQPAFLLPNFHWEGFNDLFNLPKIFSECQGGTLIHVDIILINTSRCFLSSKTFKEDITPPGGPTTWLLGIQLLTLPSPGTCKEVTLQKCRYLHRTHCRTHAAVYQSLYQSLKSHVQALWTPKRIQPMDDLPQVNSQPWILHKRIQESNATRSTHWSLLDRSTACHVETVQLWMVS